MTDEELHRARALVDAAIDAPWTVDIRVDGRRTNHWVIDGNGMWVADLDADHKSAAFIAEARTLVPKLLDEIARLRRRILEGT